MALVFFKNKKMDPKVLMNEGPTVIGMMSVIIGSGGSLDTAVRDVAKNGPKGASTMFKTIVCNADTRAISDIKTGLSSMLTSLPEFLSAFRRSVHMVIAASESNNINDKSRMLKDASDISLAGLKETGETYSSSLNMPCMAVFGLGIMVPMVLMSILPMLSISGMFGSSAIDPNLITGITLVGIPAIIVMTILSVKDKNPFMSSISEKIEFRYIAPFISAVPVAFVVWNLTNDMEMSLIASLSVSGSIVFASMYPEVKKEKIRSKREQYLKDSIFELGNMLIAGDNFETSLVSAIGIRKECQPIAESVRREMIMCRGDCCSAIKIAISPTSELVADLLCDIYRCAEKDIRDSGRLAISIGRQLQDQESVRKTIGNKLKSMVDMMTGTAMVFAPLVLGMSVSMLGPLSSIIEGSNVEDTTVVLSIYLAELCVMMSFLTAYLNGRTEPKEIVYRIGMMLPISLCVFLICTMISF